MDNFSFDKSGQFQFVIRNFSEQSPFSSFLPGIAGRMGIPMWVFYVNRGQAIAAFGVESKDTPILEFQPANKAYQTTPTTGFRTFIKLRGELYEPFGLYPPSAERQRDMIISPNALELRETAPAHDLQVGVLYFTLTDEPLAGLVRRVTITNTAPAPVDLAVLDGLPVIIPYGVNDWILKQIARTAEAWMGVFNVEQNIPFYRVRSSIVDKVEVEGYEAGHFYAAFTDHGRLPAIVDPALVFGPDTSLSYPHGFAARRLDELYAARQICVGKTPCGFFAAEHHLPAGETLTLYEIVGHVSSIDAIGRDVEPMLNAATLEEKYRTAEELVQHLTDTVAIQSGQPVFDAYTRQTFLDNVLRGGWPVLLGSPERPFVQHIYSRKHGDLERDYNAFYLAPEFYSQGNGNYRDVNQNRREDVWLNPRVEDYNVIAFMNLIQADGYNPLVIVGNRYTIPPDQRAAALALVDNPGALDAFLAQPFTPGALLKFVAGIQLKTSPEEFLTQVLSHAGQHFEADPGEGYWIDHWTYNLDLIENYLTICPDRTRDLLFDKTVFTFYDNPAVVRPRAEKYVLAGDRVRQLNAVVEDEEKAALIASRTDQPHVMRRDNGQGEIIHTTLVVKLVCLALVKFATLDPLGMGIEMEAGKPGWDDALNGLPGLFGSSLAETYALVRLLAFVRGALTDHSDENIALPIEVYDLLQTVIAALDAYERTDAAQRDHIYWDTVATARETYRARIRLGFDGMTQAIPLAELDRDLQAFAAKCQAGIARAERMNDGLPPTFFSYKPVEWEVSASGIRVKRFEPNVLPLFLEGAVRALAIQPDAAAARQLHTRVRSSGLFDGRLKMYKVNASLDDQPLAIGRARAFTPGWLENESIWLHMEYKYLLALLKAGLYDEFYADFQQVLVPFQDPAVYGRSTLENSSFIVSSAHPDPALHGRGFVARLSGSTAEFLSILHLMMVGPQPFTVQDGQLGLEFRPALPGWLFDDQGVLRFTFLGAIPVITHNPARRDTFGPHAVQPVRYTLETEDDQPVDVAGDRIGAPYAADIRAGRVKSIDIFLA